MRFLLDTHTFLWFIEDDPRLSTTAQQIIEDDETDAFLSIASAWEIAIKVSVGKLTLRDPLASIFPHQLHDNDVTLLNTTIAHVVGIATLPFHHRDPFDHWNGTAMFGISIADPEARGKGYGTEATRLTLDYAFTALGLHNVSLGAIAVNPGAIRAYEKAGFREIGRRRQSWRIGAERYDEVLMDCLASEFESPVLRHIFVPDSPGS